MERHQLGGMVFNEDGEKKKDAGRLPAIR